MISRTKAAHAERVAAIKEMYARNVPVREIAAALGLTYGSTKVLASRIGCTKNGQDYLDYRRGYAVPDDKKAAYDELVYKLQMPAEYAVKHLGIEPLYKGPTT